MNSQNGCGANTHDAWSQGLNSNFTYSTLPTPQSVYQWMGPLVSNTILPIQLISFNTKVVQQKVMLEWKTSHEENGKYFYIQHADDEMRFKTIDSISTKNNPSGAISQYTHQNPTDGNNYYRLLQKDQDGKWELFEIKKAIINNPNAWTVLQNPIKDFINIQIQSKQSSLSVLTVTNQMGSIIHTQKINLITGTSSIQINSNPWPNGIYYVSIQWKNEVQTKQLIKQ